MEIAEWLQKNDMSLKALSEKAGIGHSTLYEAFRSRKRISRETALKIKEATEGDVSIEEAVCPERLPFVDSRKTKIPKHIKCKCCLKKIEIPRSIREKLIKYDQLTKKTR